MLQKVDHGVYDRFDLERLPFLCYKVQIDQKRIILTIDFDSIDNFVVVETAWLFTNVSNFSWFQNQQVEFVLKRLYCLLRVCYYHLYFLGKREQGLLD